MRTLVTSFLVVLACAAIGRAAPLDAKAVAGGAVWVAHVDVDAIRDSYIVKKAFETCPMLKEHAPAAFDKIKEKIGMDLRKDLHGITMYGKDTDKEHAVMIVYAQVDQHLLTEKAEKAQGHKVTKHGDFEIHSWTMAGHGKTHTAAGAFFRHGATVFAATTEGVAGALAVLNGKSSALASDSALAKGVLPGTTVLVRATAIDPKTRCPVLAQATGFRIAMGEHDGKSFYRANVTMKSAEAAEEINKISEGFRAMVSLRFGSDADVMKLVKGLKSSVDGTTLKVRWDAAAADVWTVAEKASKKMAEHMGKGGECPFAPGKHEAKKGGEKKSGDDDF